MYRYLDIETNTVKFMYKNNVILKHANKNKITN